MNNIKLKFNRFYNLIFGEKFYKKLDFNWDNLPKDDIKRFQAKNSENSKGKFELKIIIEKNNSKKPLD